MSEDKPVPLRRTRVCVSCKTVFLAEPGGVPLCKKCWHGATAAALIKLAKLHQRLAEEEETA